MGFRTKKTQKNQQKPASQTKSESGKQLTFLEHLYELRSRLFWVIGTLVVASALGFQFKDYLVSFIMAPLHGEKLVYLTPGGGFSFIFTLCLYFGALLTIPLVIYHLYRFLQPIMGKTSYRMLTILIISSALLAMTGAAFGYLVAIPAAINFLTDFAGAAVTASLTAESYLSFVMAYMFGLAALFQLPLIMFMSDHIHRFPPGTLLTSQRFVIVGAVIAAAIITPTPDLINQMIIAGPIIVIYQVGVVIIYLRHKASSKASPAIIAPAQAGLVSVQQSAPALFKEEKPEKPLAAVRPAPHYGSIDGFMRSSAVSKLALQKRPMIPARRPVQRSMRSIDGFAFRGSPT